MELLALTVLARGGSFQRCLLGRCGKAERESLEQERSQFLEVENERFPGIFALTSQESSQRKLVHWAPSGLPVSLS